MKINFDLRNNRPYLSWTLLAPNKSTLSVAFQPLNHRKGYLHRWKRRKVRRMSTVSARCVAKLVTAIAEQRRCVQCLQSRMSMTLERRYRDKERMVEGEAEERETKGKEKTVEAVDEDGRVRKIKRHKLLKGRGGRRYFVDRMVGRSTRSSDWPVCLVVRKLMDALKDDGYTQGCVARRRLWSRC